MASFIYPVIIKRPGVEKPKKAGIYYIIAANGNFLHKKLSWVEATIPVKRIAVLENQETEVHVLLPSLPRLILAKTVAFFRKVYAAHRSEAIVLLHYNNATSAWDMSIPLQHVSASAISEYDKQQRLEGSACMGTIHSHAFMNAFHSGVDQRDEAECADGIHITIGNVDMKNGFSMDMEVAINGNRFYLDPTWCDGVTKHICPGFGCSFRHPFSVREKLVDVECQEIQNWNVPDEWMRQVFYTSYPAKTVDQYGDGKSLLDKKKEHEHLDETEYPLVRHKPAVILSPEQILLPDEEKTPPLFAKAKDMLYSFFESEPYRRESHTAYCRCSDCKEYFRKKYGSAEHDSINTTRDDIRKEAVVSVDEQKKMRHVDVSAAGEKRKTHGDGVAQSGKKTQKLSWFSQQILLAAPDSKIQKENEQERTKGGAS